MTNEENKHRPDSVFPDYIPIPQHLHLFPSGTLVGWQHRKLETDSSESSLSNNRRGMVC